MTQSNQSDQKQDSADQEVEFPVVAAALAELRSTVIECFDLRMWKIVEVCASVIASLMIKDVVNPVGVVLIDNPSTGKTAALSMFFELEVVYRTDGFTASSFVSHANNKSKKALDDIDLLPKIKHKALIVAELATVFSKSKEDLLKEIGILTRVFDGNGYFSNSGSHGGRGYKGDFTFAFLGATVPLSKQVWQALSTFGARLLMYSPDSITDALSRIDKTYNDLFAPNVKPSEERIAICRKKVNALFECMIQVYGGGKFARSIEWNRSNDSPDLKFQIATLAEFVSRARSSVMVWESNSSNAESGKDFSQPILESPYRLATILYSLGRAHAVIGGRNKLTNADIALLIEIGLTSMPNDRRQVLDLLLSPPKDGKLSLTGIVSSTEITQCLKISRPSALKLIEQLVLVGIGTKSGGISNQATYLRLDPAYSWFLSPEFSRLRESRRN